ncbi:unnamed protein product [Tenebrio molitor]|nr:unnamed protein product [Tenebrio molitor]
MKALFSVTILFFVFSLIEGLPTPENHPIAKREVLRDFVSNVADIFVPTDPPPPVVFNNQRSGYPYASGYPYSQGYPYSSGYYQQPHVEYPKRYSFP